MRYIRVRLEGTPEQIEAVDGHVTSVAGDWSTPSGLAFLATDHTEAEPARLVAESFGQWETNAESDVRVAVYGEQQNLLYAD
ncbi:hypothetical protein RM780_13135 [Streptomyces sp. DSM 44917]|uniref:Uncharacterized protein n=1 Tax=Streptomyces boetiae TaxID=3075541 RepID=A0ABU2L8K4_9ACTN|nr:hypothetical protein [Streptomyces sp. DSM 44917]MDT0307900.1 hypothetical protein [Streptomyces sp. DSM 44917]